MTVIPGQVGLPPLVSPTELSGLPGGPFTPAAVAAAAETVRRIAGWHIAPERTETIVIDHDGSDRVMLPSLHVTNVASVHDLSSDSPRTLTGWRWSADGMLSGRFPEGFRVLEVTFTHGYPACPADLLPVIAGRAYRRAIAESLAGRSITYETGDNTVEQVLLTYKVRARP